MGFKFNIGEMVRVSSTQSVGRVSERSFFEDRYGQIRINYRISLDTTGAKQLRDRICEEKDLEAYKSRSPDSIPQNCQRQVEVAIDALTSEEITESELFKFAEKCIAIGRDEANRA